MGEVHRARTGDPFIWIQTGNKVPVYIAAYDYTPPEAEPIRTGMRFRTISSIPEDNLLVVHNASYNKTNDLVINRSGIPVRWHPTKGAPKDLERLDRRLFTESNDFEHQERAFKGELIHSGGSVETVKMIYREYIDDVARPAFSQELHTI